VQALIAELWLLWRSRNSRTLVVVAGGIVS
jgi:hypothetical protein